MKMLRIAQPQSYIKAQKLARKSTSVCARVCLCVEVGFGATTALHILLCPETKDVPLELTETILLSVEGFDVTIGCSALSPSSALTSGSLPSAPSGVARGRDDRPGVTPIVDFRAPRFIRDRRFRNRPDIRGLVRRILRNALGNNKRPRRPPPPTSVDTRSCRVRRTAPSGGFRINTSGGANALALDNIIFLDAVDVVSSTTDVVPLVESTPDALGSGSIVRVDACEFHDFVNGTFFIGSFSSDAPGDDSSTFDVRSSVFVNNTGGDLSLPLSGDCCGGAINIEASANSAISIVASEFSSNTATGNGGAVRLIGGRSASDGFVSVFIDSTLFTENIASVDGGAVFVGNGDTLDIRDSIFISNDALRDGGAVGIFEINAPTIRSSTFIANTASVNGGAISLASGETLDIRDSTFTNNEAFSNGGAVFSSLIKSLTIQKSSFTKNTATEGSGGAVSVQDGDTLDIRDSTFTSNSSFGFGGAVFSSSISAPTIRNSFFTKNTSVFGGAVSVGDGGTLDILESTFATNEATFGNGGAVQIFGNNAPTIRNSTFTENTATRMGGGAVSVQDGETLDIRDSIFTTNNALVEGGAVFAEELEEGFTCEMATFIGNSVNGSGGGVRTQNVGPVNFARNNFVQNEAGEEGGTFTCVDTSGSNPVFTNESNVFIDNTAPSFPNGFATGFSNTS